MSTNMIERLRAAGIHLLISAAISLMAAGIVFGIWYPGTLAAASGVTTIFLILLGVDIALGPLITLCIFNTKKRELRRDLMVIGLIQLSALLYGLHTVFIARPAFIVFTVDRFDLVFANDLSKEKLRDAKAPEFRTVSWIGPRVAAVVMPESAKERTDLMFNSISGGDDVQHLPKYYRKYGDAGATVIPLLKPLEQLAKYNRAHAIEIETLIKQYRLQKLEVGYLPLKGKMADMTVVVNKRNATIIEIVDLRPW